MLLGKANTLSPFKQNLYLIHLNKHKKTKKLILKGAAPEEK